MFNIINSNNYACTFSLENRITNNCCNIDIYRFTLFLKCGYTFSLKKRCSHIYSTLCKRWLQLWLHFFSIDKKSVATFIIHFKMWLQLWLHFFSIGKCRTSHLLCTSKCGYNCGYTFSLEERRSHIYYTLQNVATIVATLFL